MDIVKAEKPKAMVGLCRLCASLRKGDILITVKDSSNEICEKLRKCCQLNIHMDDDLPKTICQECISNLNNSHRFYLKVQEAQETLEALYPAQVNKCINTTKPQTLSAQKEALNVIPATQNDETNATNAFTQDTNLDVLLPEQPKNLLKKLQGKNLQKEKQDAREAKICKKSNFEHSYEVLEAIEDIKEDLSEAKTRHSPTSGDYLKKVQEEKEVDYTSNDNIDAHYDLVISEEKDSMTSDDIQQINELLSDDELNVEIEYMEYLEDEEIENYEDNNTNIGEFSESKRNPKHNSDLSDEIKISSWKNFKYLCFICDHISISFIDLISHSEQEHNIKQLDKLKYKCYDCRKITARYSLFLNHVRARHHPDLKLRCDACDLSCQNYNELTYHRKASCIEAKNFVPTSTCSYCFKSFNNASGLQHHVKFQHISSSRIIYKCRLCDKEFQYKNCLKSHERLHSDRKEFSCVSCDKSFHTKTGLEHHQYTHVEAKVFLCTICDRSYKTSKSLDEHRKMHTEEKSFKCQFCSRVFLRKIQKLTHERTHTGEMPYACEQCDKRFRFRSALFVHSKVHTGHRPYSCDYCEKSFADCSNRNKHVRRMHLRDKIADNKIG